MAFRVVLQPRGVDLRRRRRSPARHHRRPPSVAAQGALAREPPRPDRRRGCRATRKRADLHRATRRRRSRHRQHRCSRSVQRGASRPGRHHLVSTLIDALVARTLGLESAAVAYALPRCGIADPPGAIRGGSSLRVDAVLRAPGPLPSKAVVSLEEGAVVVPLSQLRTTTADGFDRNGAWRRIDGELPEVEVTVVDAADWARAVALARLSLGSEILGVAIEINAIAIEHVTA